MSGKSTGEAGGSCLLSCLKFGLILVCISLVLGFGWIAGVIWLLFFRKRLKDDPKKQKKYTIAVSVLSALSLLFMIFSFASSSADKDASSSQVVKEATEQASETQDNVLEASKDTTTQENADVKSDAATAKTEKATTEKTEKAATTENEKAATTENEKTTTKKTEKETAAETEKAATVQTEKAATVETTEVPQEAPTVEIKETTKEDAVEQAAVSDSQAVQAAAPESAPQPEPAPQSEPTPQSTQSSEAISGSDSSGSTGYTASISDTALVWINSTTAKKYHATSDCSGMQNAYQVTKEEAEAQGKDACKKCY